jgi:hypothetical protein
MASFSLTYANVMATIAVFLVLGGGSAVALSGSNTVFTDDVADDTQPAGGGNPAGGLVAADLRPSSVGSSEVLNNGLALADLNATSRPHKLEFSVAPGSGEQTIATIGNVRLSGDCGVEPDLFIFVKNLTAQNGTMNSLLTNQTASGGAVTLHTVGLAFGGGAEVLLHHNDAPLGAPLAAGNFDRVEGQVVFQTPGRVTTIDFHAITLGGTPGRCEFFGTAVTSNLS